MPIWIRSLIATLVLPGAVAVLIPYLIVSGSSGPVDLGALRWLGLVPLLGGGAVLTSTIWAFGAIGHGTLAPWDPPRGLVQSRLHAWVRNPMYLGVLLALVGEAIVWARAALLLYTGAVALLFHVRVVAFEEPTLRRMFGPAFEEYMARVNRWWPKPPSEAPPSHR